MSKYNEKTIKPTWKTRITGTGEESPDQLLANPQNFRIHPKIQQDALESILDEIGWVDDVIVNKTTGHIIDGHLRVELAIKRKEKTIPVKYVELTEDEERIILATFDPISAMATQNNEMVNKLVESIKTTNQEIQTILDGLNEMPEIRMTEEKEIDENIDTENECPSCGYQW